MQGTGPLNARVMIVGEAPGKREVQEQKPFVGSSGHTLNELLHDAGLLRSECFVTNVCRVQPPSAGYKAADITNFWDTEHKRAPGPDWTWSERLGGWVKAPILEGLAILDQEVSLVKPQVIIACGNLALMALTGEHGISKWRGSYLATKDGIPVIPMYHPAAVLRQWHLRMYCIRDLWRVRDLLQGVPINVPNKSYIIRPIYSTVLHTLAMLRSRLFSGPVHLSCDIETRAGKMACLGIGWSKTEALCIPFMAVERSSYWTLEEEAGIVKVLREVLTHPNALISGQNFAYDAQYILREHGYCPSLAMDTMLLHHVCFPGTDKDLGTLSSLYCEHHVYWKDDGKEWLPSMGEEKLWEYNCDDCVRTFEIAEVLTNTIQRLGLVDQAVFQHRMWWRVLNAMLLGLPRDESRRQEFLAYMAQEERDRVDWIVKTLGHPLNPKSPPQIQRLFYEDFQLPVQLHRKTKRPSTDDEALHKLARYEPLVRPLVSRILELRSIGVFTSTFLNAALDTDGRIRCSYNVAGTETFRLSSSKNVFGSGLNLQNVPSGGEEEESNLILPNIRMAFIPDEGMEVADMDLSSADLRIVVAESGEAELQAMLDAGLDPYTEVGKEFYDDPKFSKKDPRRNRFFKPFCHGTHYLGTPRGLAERLGISVREAERTQQWYFRRFPKIPQWHTNLKSGLDTTRTVSNAYGYRRVYFDRIEGTLYNQAAAWIPQSTVGLLINHIWDAVGTHLPQVQVLLQVHDSLVFQYPIKGAERTRAQLLEVANSVRVPYPKPLHIPVGFKYSRKSWGDCA